MVVVKSLIHLLLLTSTIVLSKFDLTKFIQNLEAGNRTDKNPMEGVVWEDSGILAGVQRPLEAVYFHYPPFAFNLTYLKVTFRGDKRSTVMNTARKVMKVRAWAEAIEIEGNVEGLERGKRRYLCSIKVDSTFSDRLDKAHCTHCDWRQGPPPKPVWKYQQGARDDRNGVTLDGAICSGIAALETKPNFHLEWLNLQCNSNSSNVQVGQKCSEAGVQDAANQELQLLVLKNLDRGVTSVIESLTFESINARLQKSSPLQDAELIEELETTNTEIDSSNQMVDAALSFVSDVIKEKYRDEIAIPNIEEPLQSRLLFTQVRYGSFSAKNGSLKGVASIVRDGNARMVMNGSSFSVITNLKFKSLQVQYGQYNARLLLGQGPKGRVSAKVSPLSLFVDIEVNPTTFNFAVKQLKIKNPGKLDVEVTGMGPLFNWLASMVGSWMANSFKYRIVDILQKKYGNYANDILKNATSSQGGFPV